MYLRTTKKFSWVIRMISECVSDMSTFLVVFFIGVVAFGDSFLSIAQINALRKDEVPPIREGNIYEKYI